MDTRMPPAPTAASRLDPWPAEALPGPALRAWLAFRAGIARLVLGVMGWRFHTTHTVDLTKEDLSGFPRRFVVFGEPHTHIADFFCMLLFFWRFRLPKVSFPVAAEYFYPVLGPWMRWGGAIPVETGRNTGIAERLVQQMRASETMILHIPPSAAMRKKDRWRSGFYHIARQADVPIVPAYLDASTKTFGYGPPMWLSGDVRADMDRIRVFYADKRGFRPENESRIWIKEEGEVPDAG